MARPRRTFGGARAVRAGKPTAAPSLLASLLLSGPGRAYLTGGLLAIPGAGLATRAAAQAVPLSVLRALRRPDTAPPR